MKKRISISVINDLVTDQRLHRLAESLVKEGYVVSVTGRRFYTSMNTSDFEYKTLRYRMLFTRGPLFYLCFNIRLFTSLLFMKKPDLLIAIDLDTLPANFLISRLRSVPILYDSHEYFTEVPELIHRKNVQQIWEWLETRMLPKLKFAMTVSDSISEIYKEKYGVDFLTIRNLPITKKNEVKAKISDANDKIHKIIYQGALNVGRGLELLIDSMAGLKDVLLIIVGEGDIASDLRKRVEEQDLSDRIVFKGKVKPDDLHRITSQCSLGLSLEENMGLSYRYSLPNKIFDYIQGRIPVLCSDLPEMASLVEKYQVGEVIKKRECNSLTKQLSRILEDENLREYWKSKLDKAAEELCWENEEEKFISLVRRAIVD